MSQTPETRSPLLDQIRGRRLFQWLFAYVAGAWILLELTDFLVDLFEWPLAIVQVLLTLFAFGFLAAMVLAWCHGEKGRQEVTRREVALLSGIGVMGLLAALGVGMGADWHAPLKEEGEQVTTPARSLIREAAAETFIADPRQAPLALAVLPFLNLDGPGSDDTFADGVTEDIIFEMSILPGLRVISRTSTAQYRGTTLSMVEIGRQLDVDLVLEGSVRRGEDRARIVAQLIDARTDEHVWSGSYDRDLSDILQVQAEVAGEIARALAATLGVGEVEVMVEVGREPELHPPDVPRVARTVDPETYRSLMEGRRLARSSDPTEMERGVELLREVVVREPDLESALAALAEVLEISPSEPASGWRWATGEAPHRLRNLVRETLEEVEERGSLRPGRSPAWRLALDRGAMAEAEEALVTTLAANPNDAGARRWYGLLLASAGRLQEGLEHLQVARSLDPASIGVQTAVGAVHLRMGGFQEAVAAFDEALARVPAGSPQAINLRVERSLARGRGGAMDEAIRELQELAADVQGEPDAPQVLQVRGALGYLLALGGREEEARAILDELQGIAPFSGGVALAVAQVLAGLGEVSDARAALKSALGDHGWSALTPAAWRVLEPVDRGPSGG